MNKSGWVTWKLCYFHLSCCMIVRYKNKEKLCVCAIRVPRKYRYNSNNNRNLGLLKGGLGIETKHEISPSKILRNNFLKQLMRKRLFSSGYTIRKAGDQPQFEFMFNDINNLGYAKLQNCLLSASHCPDDWCWNCEQQFSALERAGNTLQLGLLVMLLCIE